MYKFIFGTAKLIGGSCRGGFFFKKVVYCVLDNSTWVAAPASGPVYPISGGIMSQVNSKQLLITGGRDGNGATSYNFLYDLDSGIYDWEVS